MGIECYLFTLHQETLAWLCDNPDSASSFVEALETSSPELVDNLSRLPNAPAVIVDGLRSVQHDRIRTRTKLIELCPFPHMAEDLSATILDLDKGWQLLDTVLRQLSKSRSFAIAECLRGGHDIGGSLDFGHVHVLWPEQVVTIRKELASVSESDFTEAAVDADRLRGSESPDLLSSQIDDLLYYFDLLCKLYRKAADESKAVGSFFG